MTDTDNQITMLLQGESLNTVPRDVVAIGNENYCAIRISEGDLGFGQCAAQLCALARLRFAPRVARRLALSLIGVRARARVHRRGRHRRLGRVGAGGQRHCCAVRELVLDRHLPRRRASAARRARCARADDV